MSQIVCFTGRFVNEDEETADIVCGVATASVPRSRREVGAGGSVQISVMPTGIVLYDLEPESMVALRKGEWTLILWSGLVREPGRNLQIRQIFIEGANVRVIV